MYKFHRTNIPQERSWQFTYLKIHPPSLPLGYLWRLAMLSKMRFDGKGDTDLVLGHWQICQHRKEKRKEETKIERIHISDDKKAYRINASQLNAS